MSLVSKKKVKQKKEKLALHVLTFFCMSMFFFKLKLYIHDR
jgi:hypothetical protein